MNKNEKLEVLRMAKIYCENKLMMAEKELMFAEEPYMIKKLRAKRNAWEKKVEKADQFIREVEEGA